MTRDEAIINLKLSQNRIGGIKKEEWNALQMAIEALSAEHKHCWDCKHYEPKYNVCHAPEVVKQVISKSAEEYEDYEHATLVDIKEPLKPSAETHEIRTETHGVCLISKDDAIEEISKGVWNVHELVDRIKALPSDAVDCTDFIEWLVDRVLDETIWEYNSVAYGEIICRKLEKLGVLEVTEEPSYYIRPSADAVQGEWQTDTDNRVVRCSVCGTFFNKHTEFFDFEVFAKYCPYCGAKMKGGAE